MNYVATTKPFSCGVALTGTLLPGGLAHVFGEVEYDECEDPSRTACANESELPPNRTKPKVTYEATVVCLAKLVSGSRAFPGR